ncbi:MAG TPA: hypothetical protein VGQ15_16130 [Gaiellaceae bacterium]|jgi:hypothetical protein|nr:hypothetical protein [Gaiellaceae bacterium]
MFNRRYAFIGWLVWNVAKQVGKRKAKRAVPSVDMEKKRPNRPAIIAVLVALGGTAWLVGRLKRRGGSGHVDE